MSGLYIHIPYCKQVCHYCAFHKSVSTKDKSIMLECIRKEIFLRKEYLGGDALSTIYFGGGTPSIYSPKEIGDLLSFINTLFDFKDDIEISLECNPDDLNDEYLYNLSLGPVNRLSLGVQSFHDDDLKFMNRRHSGKEAIDAVKLSQKYGFDNISVDLIYGVPGLTVDKWRSNLKTAFDLNIQHISSYHLMYDSKTVFSKKLKKGQIKEIGEEDSLDQFKLLIEKSKENNFIHYEISNFCKEGYISKHNSSYWRQEKYLGVGPSAHSYNLSHREWNISHNKKYIEAISNSQLAIENEFLSPLDKYNDYVLTSLRTHWGLDLEYVKNNFGDKLHDFCIEESEKYLKSNDVRVFNNCIILTDKGVFKSNDIMSDFFYVED